MSQLNRIVVVDEAQRNKDCTPGPSVPPKEAYVDLAADLGGALDMPFAAESRALEDCELSDFVLWRGSWECFIQRQHSPEGAGALRAHRLGLLDVDRDEERQRVELIRPAFSLPFMSRFEVDRGAIGGHIYGLKEIVAKLGLKTTGFRQTEHYQIVYAEPALTLPQLIATYLRAYWEVVGQ